MSLKFQIVAKILFTGIIVFVTSLGAYIYFGTYLDEEASPDGQYTLRYYRSFNRFLNPWFVREHPGETQ